MTERLYPPTARERAAFDAATRAAPSEFVSLCRMVEMDPKKLLDSFDAAPWRWLFYFSLSDLVSGAMRDVSFPPPMRARLDAAREYVETPWWRRILGWSARHLPEPRSGRT
ncbi:MAG: hypothetical protein ACHQ4F_06900 [Candidatus Dormibacteria bacterium]